MLKVLDHGSKKLHDMTLTHKRVQLWRAFGHVLNYIGGIDCPGCVCPPFPLASCELLVYDSVPDQFLQNSYLDPWEDPKR